MNTTSPVLDIALETGQQLSHGTLLLCSVLLLAAFLERGLYLPFRSHRPSPKSARGLYGVFAWVGGIAPMAGLLGTVTGIMQSFAASSAADGDPTRLMAGIGLALTATASGLVLAMGAYSARALFGRRTDEAIHSAAGRMA